YYTQIQSINRLFTNQGEIAAGSQKELILGEAHFVRADYYYLLWRQYGGVMLIDEPFDPLNDGKKFPRASYEQMVDAIVEDTRAASQILPVEYESTDVGRVTKGAALTLMAKTYLWASSAVFQNKDKSYLGFTDDRSAAMLDSAKVAYENVIGMNHYQLIPISGTTLEEIKQEYRKIFLTKNSQESILEVQHSDDGNYDTGFGHKLDRDAAAPYFTGTTAAYTPTQNHVDEYGMQPGYTYNAQKPYEGRDYRFYANILYDGSTYNGHVMDIHYTRTGNTETAGVDLKPYGTSTTAAVTRTGYYMGKFVNEQQQINNDETYASNQDYIIWRYAEILLDYAEVMFRLGDTQTALQEVNAIRQRVHMDALPSLTWDQLVNERRVELAFEESTYWDILRWGEAEDKLNGSTNPIKAMKVTIRGNDTTYVVSNMDRFPGRVRRFQSKQYNLPIPWDEIRYHGIEQNPEWEEV
ncbi:MAG: RagB/SusD family nutrient uptake outer membrane protein, partial [Paraprevotella sp.]|nr:RagB/SusD family nutrient uptake outer membrane protein [Paraprevotella sp.]